MHLYQPMAFSASSAEALEERASELASQLEAISSSEQFQDWLYELNGSPPRPHRRVALVRDRDDAIAMLRKPDRKRLARGVVQSDDQRVAFVLPGPGVHSHQMLRDVYEHEPVFRRHIDELSEYGKRELDFDLKSFLYSSRDDSEQPWRMLSPAVFAVEVALARQWMSWGIQPVALLGYSLGEIAAATLGGVFTAESGLRLAHERGRLLDSIPPGAMTSVALHEADVRPDLSPQLDLASVRSDSACVVAGPVSEIEAFEKRLEARQVNFVRLDVKGGGHSLLVEPIMDKFASAVESVERRKSELPIVSNLTGDWLTHEEASSPDYWAGQLRKTVQFAKGLRTLVDAEPNVLLEVGPGTHLTSLVASQLPRKADVRAVPSVSLRQRSASDTSAEHLGLLLTLGRLWTSGVAIDWTAFHSHEKRRPSTLPPPG